MITIIYNRETNSCTLDLPLDDGFVRTGGDIAKTPKGDEYLSKQGTPVYDMIAYLYKEHPELHNVPFVVKEKDLSGILIGDRVILMGHIVDLNSDGSVKKKKDG